ncbi:MAG: hypothetical protein BMS9Abin26_1701 [Gammaproteobacteria bacterium]|nr:MAG: hypothetical protein BMS9Abin26_1701 [Gammaproteobacteria bacterium]
MSMKDLAALVVQRQRLHFKRSIKASSLNWLFFIFLQLRQKSGLSVG